MPKDLSQQRFGDLTALHRVPAPTGFQPKAYWLCQCSCGQQKAIRQTHLLSGGTRSCGCLNSRVTAERNTTHGMAHSPEYRIWAAILRRCSNRNTRDYPRYGGRGITVCAEWRQSFQRFYEDMGPRPSNSHTIDRVDNEGSYSPENCRWATIFEQANNKRNNLKITWNGQTETIARWSEITGLTARVIYKRVQRHWSPDRMFTQTPKPFNPMPRSRAKR